MFVIVGVYFLFFLTFVYFFWEIREIFRHHRVFRWIACVLASTVRPTMVLCCICFHYRLLLCFGRNVLFFVFFFVVVVILYDWQKWYSKYLVTGSPKALTIWTAALTGYKGHWLKTAGLGGSMCKSWVLLVEDIFGASVSSKSFCFLLQCRQHHRSQKMLTELLKLLKLLRWHWWKSN